MQYSGEWCQLSGNPIEGFHKGDKAKTKNVIIYNIQKLQLHEH